MDLPFHIRPLQAGERDYEAIAHIIARFPDQQHFDFEVDTGAGLRAFDASFAASGHTLQRYIAEHAGRPAGYAYYFEIPWLREPRCFWCTVRVDPEYQRRGLGARLYGQVLDDLSRLGATAVQTMVHELHPAIGARIERAGFREVLRSWGFFLDTRGFDAAPFHTAAERAAARGITFTTLAREQARDPGWLPKLYELHATLTYDIPLPGHPHPAPALDWFVEYISDGPPALPEACFIAMDGERYIGESFLHRDPAVPDALDQKVTGVRSEYRGYGIALTLKLQTIAYARQHGYTQIHTGVESNNPSMLAINRKLGFVQGPGLILFEKLLEIRD